MLLRPQWKRLRRHWVCYGIGTICASTLAFTGCSRAPMSRFKELTSAPATETAEQPSETRSVSTEQPDPRDAVATQKSSPSTQEGRVSIVGDGGRRGFKQYREGYADLRNRLLNRGGTESGDPFLEAEAEAARDFPATDSLSPRRTDERAPTADGPVARADLNRDSKAAVGVASMQRTLPQDDLRRSPTPQGVATTGRQEGVVRTKPQEKQTSRLEQLRAELRAQQAGDASDADSGVGIVRAGDSNRGTVLSTGQDAPVGVACTNARRPDLPTQPEVPLRTAEVEPASSSTAGVGTSTAATGDASLRVQSLLVSAEWLASRGDLEQGYRNAVLAQHLAEYGNVSFKSGDRVPTEVARNIWDQIQTAESTGELAASLPPPKTNGPATAPPQRNVPDGAFPTGHTAWHRATGPSSLIPVEGALPVISPNGTKATSPQPRPATASQPAADELPDVAKAKSPKDEQAATDNPVQLAAIDAGEAQQKPRQKPLAAPAAQGGKGARPAAADASDGGVVNAMAEAPARPASPKPNHAEPAALTVPAMAALPKVDRTLPVDGPALGGPKLAQADADSPPFLEVIGARQLPSGPAAVETPTKKRRGLLWGIGAMVVVLLGAAFAFRRRWSAGAAVRK